MSGYVPPFFSKFGKSASDLLKQKFESDNRAKFVRKTEPLTLEQGVSFSDISKGYLKVKYNDDKVANASLKSAGLREAEVEVNTDPLSASKFVTKFNPFTNFFLFVEGTTKDSDKNFNGRVYKVKEEFSREYATTSAQLTTDCHVHKVNVSGSVGFDGFAVGGDVTIDVGGSSLEVSDGNLGAEYAAKDLTVSLFTAKKLESVNFAFFQKLNASTKFGAILNLPLDSLTVGGSAAAEYKVSDGHTLRAKVEVPAANFDRASLSLAREYKLNSPQLALSFFTQHNLKTLSGGNLKASKFGVGLTFGDS